MLELRLSIFSGVSGLIWHAYLGDLPVHDYIDGIEWETPCNLNAIRESVGGEGVFPILLCSCGDPGCESYWIKVSRTKRVIKWGKVFMHNEHGEPGKIVGDVNWKFEKIDYANSVKLAIETSMAIKEKMIFGKSSA